MEIAGFGGGCHWCTEAVFQALHGVHKVEQGFARSDAPADGWSEAVRVTFDPDVISLDILIEVHVRTHAATKLHSMRGKYRSAIYTTTKSQARRAASALTELQAEFDGEIVTAVLAERGFKDSDSRLLNYYQQSPERPFCKRYIDPKLDVLKQRFGRHYAGHDVSV